MLDPQIPILGQPVVNLTGHASPLLERRPDDLRLVQGFELTVRLCGAGRGTGER